MLQHLKSNESLFTVHTVSIEQGTKTAKAIAKKKSDGFGMPIPRAAQSVVKNPYRAFWYYVRYDKNVC